MSKAKRPPLSLFIQIVFGFIIPTVILMAFSDESKLGPVTSMVLALAFPVVLEVYSFFTGRKASWISLFAIIGILLIGVISFFGLSEEWLGVRRAGIYGVAALAVVAVLLFKPQWLDTVLGKLLDMPTIRKAAEKKNTEAEVTRLIKRVWYLFAILLVLVTIWSYVLTVITISAPTGSAEFNAEYAQLRLIGLPLVSGPFLIGMVSLVVYLAYGLEKLTGIDIESLLKKKPK